MNQGARLTLSLASRLLEYPDELLIGELPALEKELATLGPKPGRQLAEFIRQLSAWGQNEAQEHYVRVFDHNPAASLYLSWHRYGNDRGQGKAMAALNGLYRMAGFEPVPGVLPDYLPRMLEFLGVCEDWAAEVLLDGFGPEMKAIHKNLEEAQSPYAKLLACALEPLETKWPGLFKPRSGRDRTIRPLARPEEESLFQCASSQHCQGCKE